MNLEIDHNEWELLMTSLWTYQNEVLADDTDRPKRIRNLRARLYLLTRENDI